MTVIRKIAFGSKISHEKWNSSLLKSIIELNAILSEDYGEYLDLVEQKNNGKITEVEFNKQVNLITIDNLFTIKTETYNINDFVIIGFLDNKLTNAFILCKNRS